MSSQREPCPPPDPTDPAARQATIAHLRGLLEDYDQEPAVRAPAPTRPEASQRPEAPRPGAGGPGGKAPAGEPATHAEWVERGREIALRQLGFAARSSHQLREAMLAREVPPEAAAEVIERLTRVGLIDDAEYAAMLVRTRQSERGLARRALLAELAKKGIDPALALEAVDQVSADDEAEAARAIVRKRVASMRALDPTKRRNRLYGALARRGYNAATARAAIDEVLAHEGLALY